jgi:hypothetical protein
VLVFKSIRTPKGDQASGRASTNITVLKRELSAPVADQKLGFSMYLL